MQRARAAGSRGRTVGRQGSAGRKQGGAGSRQAASPGRAAATDGATAAVQELLDLQREAGNQAVTYLLQTPALQRQDQRDRPADVAVGFNPIDRAHNLVRAIDQSDARPTAAVSGGFGFGAGLGYGVMDKRIWKRHVDFTAVVQALDGLTAAQVALVDAEYRRYEKRSLEHDLLGSGQSGFQADLSHAQRIRIAAMLGGTQAGLAEDPAAARARRLEADAAELNQLLYGKRSADVVERIATILRRSGEENAELIATYERLFVTRLGGDLMRLGAEHSGRALALLGGYAVAADAMRLGRLRLRLTEIDAKLAELNPTDTAKRMQLAFTYNPHLLRYDIDRLQKERRKIASEVEQLIAATMEEGGAEQVRRMTLGDVEGLLGQVAGPAGQGREAGATAEVIRARIGGSVPARTATELRRLHATGKLNAAALTQALRGLRDEASADARRLHPDLDEAMLAAEVRLLSDQYLADLRSSWDGMRSGDEPTFDQLLAKGNETERELNQALSSRGRPDDVTELVLALRGGRKDLETVKRILADKHPGELEEIKKGYFAKTGRTLDSELFGNAPTRTGEGSVVALGAARYVVGPDGVMRPAQMGKASGSDRLLLEDYLQRVEEGGWSEIRYLAARAEREYAYTIANRGATGWWRDKWGNEARSLLDATIRDVRDIKKKYAALVLPVGWASLVMRPQLAQTAEAGALLQRMRLARATIRGDRKAYEQATAKLRATFQAVASFVLQAALTAILTPAAGALFAARGVAFARTALVTFVRTTSVGIASQVGANVAVYGSEYSAAMLKRDLLTGLGGAVGSAAAEKLAQAAFASVAKGMADRLGKRASDEIVKVASTVGSMEGSAVAEGKSLTDDLTIQNVIEEYVLGKVGEGITEQTRKGLGLPADISIDPDAYRRYERVPAVGGDGGQTAGGPDQQARPVADDGAQPGETYVPMTLPEPSGRGLGDALPARSTRVRDTQEMAAQVAGQPATPSERSAARRQKLEQDLTNARLAHAHAATRLEKAMAKINALGLDPAKPGMHVSLPLQLEYSRARKRWLKASARVERAEEQLKVVRDQDERSAENPIDQLTIENEARPDARARDRAREFAPLYSEWPTLEPPQRRARIEEIVNVHLDAAGLNRVEVVPSTDVSRGNAEFDHKDWKLKLNPDDLNDIALLPEMFAEIAGNASHEARHALHIFRGMRAALNEGTFNFDLDIDVRAIGAARAANMGSHAEPLAPGTPAYGEALSIYENMFGAGRQRRNEELRAKDAALAVYHFDRDRRKALEADINAGRSRADSPEYAAAKRAEQESRRVYIEAHNRYVAQAEEIDAWRRGAAVEKAVIERVELQVALREAIWARDKAAAAERAQMVSGDEQARDRAREEVRQAEADVQEAQASLNRLDRASEPAATGAGT